MVVLCLRGQGLRGNERQYCGEEEAGHDVQPEKGFRKLTAFNSARRYPGERVGFAEMNSVCHIAVAFILVAMPLRAQCPDGAPPPCRGAPAVATTIAVLPFEARDTSLTLLAEGLADQISTNLGQVARIHLSPPSSVRYVLGHGTRDPARVSHALGARWLVDGQMLSSRGNVRVSVQLVDVTGRRVRWTGGFQRPAEDLFAVISAVADSVATAVVGTLAPAERARLTRRPTASNAAMVAYARGVAALHQFDERHSREAIASLESATAADSTFAPAWAALATAWIWQDHYTPPRQKYPRARAAVQRALTYDPQSAPALAALAAITFYYDWDTPRAESLARRAVRLDSSNGPALLYLAEILVAQGRFDEAAAMYHEAIAADTINEPIAVETANGLQLARHTDESLALIARWRARSPQSENWAVAEALTLSGSHRCASSPPSVPVGAFSLACAGRLAEARTVADSMVVQVERGDYYYHPGWMALMFVGLGDREAALRWFERAVEARTYILVFARVDPMWDSLRGDPRFAELARRIRPEGQ
jgi:TolB-like protein/tetratricopeptide (TPR) repeat protein